MHPKQDALIIIDTEVSVIIDMYTIISFKEVSYDYNWLLEKRAQRLLSELRQAGYHVPAQKVDNKIRTPFWVCKSILSTVHHWIRGDHRQMSLFIKDKWDVIELMINLYTI